MKNILDEIYKLNCLGKTKKIADVIEQYKKMLDKPAVVPKSNFVMETHPYEQGKNDMREQMLAFIYERYCYNKTFHGKESQVALELKRLILDIREDQAHETEKQTLNETLAE
jgi:hypothetical protein